MEKDYYMSLISIIIPSYNRASLIGQTIESVQAQSYRNWELIIVEDGSTDNSFNVIQPYLEDDRISLYFRPSERPGGGNAARNYGFELAQGDYIKWLDSDDLLTQECLEVQLKIIESEDTDVVFCRSRFFVQDNSKIKLGDYWHPGFSNTQEILSDFIRGKVRFSNNDGLWRREIFLDSPYEEDLKNSQEYLMMAKMLAQDIKVSLYNEVLVLIRQHSNQMSSSRDFGDFVKNQCLSRYLILKVLKENNKLNQRLFIYLIKSMLFYIIRQINRSNFNRIVGNIWIWLKSWKFIPLR
ncbi:glycosyltransferase family 2 protein [Gramella sp. BOM4]|nr:glycosyltransferase family 2 protein [Christiangramia bathymodioli]